MPPEAETLKEIQRLLAAGEVQAAADLAGLAGSEAQKAADIAAGKETEPAPPREPNVIVLAFMEAVASRHGNHRDLAMLVAEMKASLAEDR